MASTYAPPADDMPPAPSAGISKRLKKAESALRLATYKMSSANTAVARLRVALEDAEKIAEASKREVGEEDEEGRADQGEGCGEG